MARDHRKLHVFADAHQLTLLIYKHTRNFPRDEWYVLRLQMRQAAVSIPSNLVEGNARRTPLEALLQKMELFLAEEEAQRRRGRTKEWKRPETTD